MMKDRTRSEHAPKRYGSDQEDLRERLRRTEAELERIYGSPEWRRLHRWRRLQVELGVWRHRLFHPVDFARSQASRMLPLGWRLKLIRLFRGSEKQPGTQSHEASPRPPKVSLPGAPAWAPRPTLLCFPVIEWDFRRQRPQQLLERLASRGWPVHYVSLHFDRATKRAAIDSEELAPGIHKLRLPSTGKLSAGTEPLGGDDTRVMARAIGELYLQRGITSAVILCHSPFWFPLAKVLHRALGWPLVYDRMDLHEGFETTYQGIGEDDRKLQQEADLVLASSRVLAEESATHARRVVHLPNGCDWTTWQAASPSPRLEKLPHPIIGYYGAISSWFDSELVVALALSRPTWTFVLIGSTWDADTSRLEQLENVHLLGEIPYHQLPSLAAAFDAAILPRRRSPLTEAMEPVKLYEMLALGLDIVTPPLASLDTFDGLIRTADGPESFLAVLEEVLRHPSSPEEIARRRDFARRNSWEERVATMEAELTGLFPAVTIGIVTYNNRELSALCLESIRRSTVHPNYEVVVVDNASTDGTREWLEELQREWPRLRVIANAENRGFAAACNQAFSQATGEILCFLNNDTVVTRGWLSTMVRYLEEHPETGMVGPVSNGVANSARVDPGYSDMSELDEWAESWTRQHRGESFPIPMLALYCAALRRDVWEEVGPLDESFGIGMFEDDDYSRRVRRAGYELRCLRDAYVHHWQMASFGKLPGEEYARLFEENRRKYLQKWRHRPRCEGYGSASPATRRGASREPKATQPRAVPPKKLPVYDSAESSNSIRAMITDLVQYSDLLRLLVGTNLKTRYKRSLLGVAWTLLNPLATMIVMTIAFSALFRFSLPDYPVYVLAGLTFWTFFQQSTTQAMSSLVWGSGLLKKVHIPAAVFPLSAVGTGVVNMALSFVPILLIMIVLRHPFTWALLFVPVAMALVMIFALGISLILSSLAIFFSDVVEMYGVFLRIWFYLTPVMYPENIVPERFLWMIHLNPLYHFMLCWRAPIYDGTLPAMHSIVMCILWATGMLLAGAWVFSRQEHQFALRA